MAGEEMDLVLAWRVKVAPIPVLAVLAAGVGAEEETPVASVACGNGVLLRVSDPSPRQGRIVVVEVRSDTALAGVEGFALGESLHFWHDADSRVYQALLGVDLLQTPVASTLRARAAPESGPPLECGLELRVEKGDFPVQRLEVPPRYVELSAEDLARAREETAELGGIFSSTTPERLWQRAFRAPVEGYEPSGSFGRRRVFNRQPRSPHTGEDFPAPAGTAVRASARGRVVLAKGLFFLGNTVILDHGFGLFSFYGHLSALNASAGALVEEGDVLGKVGATGRVTGAHLHWGVRLGDARVDPMELLRLGR